MSSELGDSDEDGWLVGDDEDIEMIDDGENEASNRMLDVQIDDHQLAKQNKKISGPTRRKIVGPLIPVVKGPIWEDTLGLVSASMFEGFRIQMINGKLKYFPSMTMHFARYVFPFSNWL
jgi:hypothetical protein